jgi:hypothetical protein
MVQSWLDIKIRDYSAADFSNRIKKSLAEIVFLTGGKMYDKDKENEKDFYHLQIEVIGKFLLQAFSHLTFSEIVNAFYLNSAGKFSEIYRHYGRELNAEFVGSVLSAYVDYKRRLTDFDAFGRKLELALDPIINPQTEIPVTWSEEDTINSWRRAIEEAYMKFINDLEMNEGLFPAMFYTVLEKDGVFKTDSFQKHLRKAKTKLAKDLQSERLWRTIQQAKSGKPIKEGKSSSVDFQETGITITKLEQQAAGFHTDRYYDTNHIDNQLNKYRKLVKMDRLDKEPKLVLASKQMMVKEYFLRCFNLDMPHIYAQTPPETH